MESTSKNVKDCEREKAREVADLEEVVANIPEQLRSSVVSHRGFHDVEDKMDRPLENTLDAFLTSWKYLDKCECDITHLETGELIISHDETFERLIDKDLTQSEIYEQDVTDLDGNEIKEVKLRDGSDPLSLRELLFALHNLHDPSKQLIIEIKKGANPNVICTELRKLAEEEDFLALIKHNQIPILMSFNCKIMTQLAEEFGDFRKEHGTNLELPKLLLLTTLDSSGFQYVEDSVPLFKFNLTEEGTIEKLLQFLLLDPEEGSRVDLHTRIDGVYMEFQETMVDGAKNCLKRLREHMFVGVYLIHPKHDKLENLKTLLQDGGVVDFLNTDFPESSAFFSKVRTDTL
eukprot:augustus_masked-scaffold_12-processed-gene-9.52-mRNA-1 protein AED:0.39 eAED:1.00 QI:0/-1/0/1/-1/1/1/0/346